MMLQLQSISLTQFKNYSQTRFSFNSKIIGICGSNGIGKTNLLDAIYYLCFTKSYISSGDAQCVMQAKQGFRIEGNFMKENRPVKVLSVLRENGKKEFSLNDELYPRVSKHIGNLPAVMITPDDVDLILGGSEQRRKFIDALICQLNAEYLQQLMDYNKLLQQRNGLLKHFTESGRVDQELLQVMNDQLVSRGNFVYNTRKQFLESFLRQAESHYQAIARRQEPLNLCYKSQLHSQDMQQLLKDSFPKDLALQRTTAGIHRDDLDFQLSGEPFRQIASQGQRKSLLFGLKLTEFETLQAQKGFAPILLLDDVFEKLDAERMQNLLTEVCIDKEGQVFITDTHRDRLELQLSRIGAAYQIIEINEQTFD